MAALIGTVPAIAGAAIVGLIATGSVRFDHERFLGGLWRVLASAGGVAVAVGILVWMFRSGRPARHPAVRVFAVLVALVAVVAGSAWALPETWIAGLRPWWESLIARLRR